MSVTLQTEGRAAQRYSQMEPKRTPYLNRGIQCAKLTLPYVCPPLGHNNTTKLKTPFNGVGPRGVQGLASKTSLALLPPSQPFFRLRPDEHTVNVEDLPEEDRATLEEGLSRAENTVAADIEAIGDRTVVIEMLKHLFITGNVLFYSGATGSRIYGIEKYVCRRDHFGEPREIVVKESITFAELEEQYPEFAKSLASMQTVAAEEEPGKKNVDIYTQIVLRDGRWREHQEVNGKLVPGSEGSYPKDKSPWLPLRMVRVDGEDWGRSYVEQFLGDLITLESLTKSIVKASAIGAKVVFLVKPGSSTKAKTIAEADSGDIKQGNAEDVGVLQADKYHDLQTAVQVSSAIEKRLAYAFLESTTVRRDAERVTAEEIRYLIQELEDALGGLYSMLTTEFQVPYVRRRMAVLQRQGRMPALPDKSVRIVVVTGVDALGRGHQRQRLIEWLKILSDLQMTPVLNQMEVAKELAIMDGLEWKMLLRDPAELQQEQNMAKLQDLTNKLGPAAIGAAAKVYTTPTGGPTPNAQAGSPQGNQAAQ